ncbi:MAG: histidine kinase [Pseudomonadota bacterium]
MLEPDDPPARSLAGWKLATAVIIGFWCLHLAYRTTIALVEGDSTQLFDPALDLSLALGFVMSFGFCGLLAVSSRRGLAFGLGLAALLSLPASALHASTELLLFYHLSPQVNGKPMQRTLPDGTVMTVSASGDVTYAKPGGGEPTRVKLPPLKQVVRDQAVETVTKNTSGWYFFFFGLGSFYVGMVHAARLRSMEQRTATYRRLAQHAQLETLRYQINPHLLFNTLNSLSALMMAGRTDAAEEMILNLSRFYRSTLAIDPTGDISLREELELQRLYLDIEAVRYPDRLRVAIDAAEELLDAQVPALLLQPLVENAIKHGVARRTARVTISIVARREPRGLAIEVENEAGEAGANGDVSGTGTGLRNVEQRLQTRFGPEASCTAGPVDAGRFRATVTLPLVRA